MIRGVLYLNNSITSHVIWNDSVSEFPRRVSLNLYGVLQGYVWNAVDASWTVKALDLNYSGGDDNSCLLWGQCGVNSICYLASQTLYDCKCPPGFDFINKQDHFAGCIRNPSLQNCSRTEMQEIRDVNWPENDYARFETNESYCKQACYEDSMCMAVIYGSPFCWKKASPLINGREELISKAFVKICDAVQPPLPGTKGKQSKVLAAVGISLMGGSTILAAISLIIWFHARRQSEPLKIVQDQHRIPGGLNAFSYQEI
ncbi:hypothetical protein KI387_042900 [Taxus chinensis]|uniref:EGF-like domain-containing protein n=1 Tax=Taxus chinensis TaxID=29808 RepID=A0AA38F7P8_TAXCH|nr:hypothetical protein KI387_042900 [Taxus chinensis]